MSMDANDLSDELHAALIEALKLANDEEQRQARVVPRPPAYDFFPAQTDGEMVPAFAVFCQVIADTVSRTVIEHIRTRAEATVEVNPGIEVKTAGSAAAQTGVTTSVGTGKISTGGIQ